MQTLTPLPCSATTTHPLGLRVQSPEPAVESGRGLRAQGCAGSSLLIFTTSPVPKPELCHCRGHLSQGRELHSCLSAGGTFRWTEHLTSHIFNIKRVHFSILQHNRNVTMASACVQAAGCQSLRARRQPEIFFPGLGSKFLSQLKQRPSSTEQAPEVREKRLPKKGRQNPQGFAQL